MILATTEIPGQYTVQLSVNDKHTHWYVTYGLQKPIVTQQAEKALKEYSSCVMHAMECANWLD